MFWAKVCSLALLGVSLAPAQMMRVTVVEVKPERVADYLDLQKKVTAAYQKMGYAYRSVYGPAAVGPQNVYTAFVPMDKFADLDGGSIMKKALGEGGYAEYMAQARQNAVSVRYEVVERRPELTIDEGPRPGGLYQVVHVQVKPGHEAAFEGKYKPVVEAIRKAGHKTLLTSRVVMGEKNGHYRIGIPYANFAELDKGGIAMRAMGKDAYEKFRQAIADDLVEVRYEFVQLQADLSFRK